MIFKPQNASGLLALLLVSSALYTAHSQQVGSPCGPSHDKTGRWMKLPATALSATGSPDPTSAGSSGCSTSDNGIGANVQVELPYGSWTIFNVTAKVKAPVNADPASFMAVVIGAADAPQAVKELRKKNATPQEMQRIYENYDTCTRRKLRMIGSSVRKMGFNCETEKGQMAGNYINFVAPGFTVCEVMVCAKQKQFSAYGLPLTREAALSLNQPAAQAEALADGADPADDVTPASSLIKPLVFESCPGYTSQSYRACPKGQQCVKVYYPGDDVCSCFSCSAFTGQRRCEQGDITVGYKSCCFTCPDQPICGVCKTPCVPEFQRVEIITGVLPTTPESYNTLAYQYSATTEAVNKGNNAQTLTVTFTFSQALTATMTYAKEFTYSEKATAEIGIPFLNKFAVEFSASQKFTTTTTNTETRTSTVTYALQQQIPGLTMQTVTADASAGMITVKVPITVKTYYTCDKVTSEDNAMIMKTNGVLNAVESNLRVTYGEQYPISPPIVLPQATQTCASNPQCAQFGLQGNCCPNDRGVYNACCSFCILKPACAAFAQDDTTMCCPARTNVMNPCCDKK